MDHAIRRGRTAAEALQSSRIPAMDFGAHLAERRCPRVRAREAEDRMSSADQFFDDDRADKSSRSSDEDMHPQSPYFARDRISDPYVSDKR